MKEIDAIIEQASDGNYSIYHDVDALPYLITGTGKTVELAKADFIQGYEDMKQYSLEQGEDFVEVNWRWTYDTATFLRDYAFAFSLAGLSRITGVNQGILSHYVNGTSRPSAKTIAKIQNGISVFARTLSDVKFV
ncbi:MAG: helix-turn-helix transcriptional regulator [Bacteroidaceae bacterium]|nr:helix-turn-helix transcriptional regulator [Bacteroidaceae bacterium]